MKKYFFLLLLICGMFSLCAQSTNGNYANDSDAQRITNNHIPQNLLKSKFKILETYEDVQGSPYIENFSGVRNNIPLGKLYDIEMNLMGTAFILYNAYTDEMEISAIEDSVDFYRLKKESNSFYIKLLEKLYRAYVSEYQINYFVILSNNDKDASTLLKKEKVIFIQGGNKQNVSLVQEEPSSYRRIKDTYYIKLDNLVYKLPSKKKSFFALFKEHEDLIRTYVKENKLRITIEKDLLAITDYYNSLSKKQTAKLK